jgi:hypothetical protein
MALSALRLAALEAIAEQDQKRRDNWVRRMNASKVGSSILVGDYGETLADVARWLAEALEENAAIPKH